MPALRPFGPAALVRKIGFCLLPLLLGTAAALGLLLMVGGPARPVYANTLSYPGCAATIQGCIDLANPGDTILISAGHYTESLTLSKAVSLTGALSTTTVLHALPNTRVLTVMGAAVNSSVVISGLQVTGGLVTGTLSCPESCGGGILIAGTAQPRLEQIAIIGNVAGYWGGGVYAENGSPLRVIDSLFQGNQAGGNGGGGLYAGASLAMTNTFVQNNSAGSGGGVFAYRAAVLQNVLFQGNQAVLFGGGLHAGASLTATDTSFISNTSQFVGGGALAAGPATVLRGSFQGNQCAGYQCNAGGFYASYLLTLTGTRFVSNTATGVGGAAIIANQGTLEGAVFEGNWAQGNGGALIVNVGSTRIINALFSRNAAGGEGDALFLYQSVSSTILHSTISSPTVASGAAIVVNSGTVEITDTLISSYTIGISLTGGSAFEDYNLFSGVSITTTGGITHGGHSLSGNPMFGNPSGGDYHLGSGSAAIDAGVEAGVAYDFEGDPRPLGAGFDIGYDEFANIRRYLPLILR